jgi:iron(III)-enterobactin esterase
MFRLLSIACLIALMIGIDPAMAQAPPAVARPVRPAPPTRDPNTPGYVTAKELPDGANAPATADGNFILGPTHDPAPEMTVQEGVPQGAVYTFTMESADSKIYPGIAREDGTFGKPDPTDPAKLLVTTSHPAPYSRRVAVYVPKQYVPGTAAPFIVGADGPDRALFTALDNLIARHRVPVMIAISIGNGSGDAQGSERGLEYDTMSGRYAEFSIASGGEAVQRETDQRPRRPGDHGRQLGRLVRLDHGVVSPGTLPPCAHLLRHLRQPAMAVEPADSPRRMGVP